MTESEKLLLLFRSFTDQQRNSVLAQFEELAKAYPKKRHHNGGYSDLWLTAIANIRDGANPWI